MRKFEKILTLLLIIMGVTLLSSCSDDKDEPKLKIPTTKSAVVGETFSFGSDGQWISSNDFVASVNNKGYVKAEHVGSCIISNGKHKCSVTITPKSTFITEPITEWGMSKAQLIAKCGNNYKETSNSIGYISNNTIAPIIVYLFDNNNKLTSSTITVSTDYSSELTDFLLERYHFVENDGDNYSFVNGYTSEKISTVVNMSLYNKSYWTVMYMSYGSSSRAYAENDFTNHLLIQGI